MPPMTFLAPANEPRSISTTLRPPRASVRAAAAPAGPAPTTIASNFSSSTYRTVILMSARSRHRVCDALDQPAAASGRARVADCLRQRGHELVQVADHADAGDLEQRRVG